MSVALSIAAPPPTVTTRKHDLVTLHDIDAVRERVADLNALQEQIDRETRWQKPAAPRPVVTWRDLQRIDPGYLYPDSDDPVEDYDDDDALRKSLIEQYQPLQRTLSLELDPLIEALEVADSLRIDPSAPGSPTCPIKRDAAIAAWTPERAARWAYLTSTDRELTDAEWGEWADLQAAEQLYERARFCRALALKLQARDGHPLGAEDHAWLAANEAEDARRYGGSLPDYAVRAGRARLAAWDTARREDANDFVHRIEWTETRFATRYNDLLGGFFTPPAKAAPDDFAAKLDGVTSSKRDIKLLSIGDLRSMPTVEPLIEGVLPASALAAIYGPSEHCKSFIALSMALHIADGQDWFGRPVKQGMVVYIAGEGASGLMNRVDAARQAHGIPAYVPFKLVSHAVDFRNPDEADRLARKIHDATRGSPVGMIVVDTLVRAMPGGDDNKSVDVGEVVAVCDRVKELFGCTVLLVHHEGRDASKGMRGSTAINAAMDASIAVLRKKGPNFDVVTLTNTKQKDGPKFDDIHFDMRVVETTPTDAPRGAKPSSSLVPFFRLAGPPPSPGTVKAVTAIEPAKPAISDMEIAELHKRLRDGGFNRLSEQSPEWVGRTLADVLGLSPDKDRAQIKTLVREMTSAGVLGTDTAANKKGSAVTIVVPGSVRTMTTADEPSLAELQS